MSVDRLCLGRVAYIDKFGTKLHPVEPTQIILLVLESIELRNESVLQRDKQYSANILVS